MFFQLSLLPHFYYGSVNMHLSWSSWCLNKNQNLTYQEGLQCAPELQTKENQATSWAERAQKSCLLAKQGFVMVFCQSLQPS